MKKILLITDVMSIGGVERVIVNTLKGIDYSKFIVSLFIMYKTEGERLNLSKIPETVEIKYLFKKPVNVKFQQLLYTLFLVFPRVINRLLVKENYDIIITTKDLFTYPISFNKCKKVMWIHGGLEHFDNENLNIIGKIKRLIQRNRYQKFEKILLLTNAAKERFSNKYNISRPCEVLVNPINNEEIEKLSYEPITDFKFKDGTNIVCASRLSVEKGIDRLIRVSIQLLNEGNDFNLLIIGDGPEKQKLKSLVSCYPHLNNNIIFLGFKENPYKYIKKCDIYVSSSFTEGFPLSVAEALILELPVLSTICNGPSEMLENGKYGLMVENSEYGLYKGLRNLLTNHDLKDYYKVKSKERKGFFMYKKNIGHLEKILLED